MIVVMKLKSCWLIFCMSWYCDDKLLICFSNPKVKNRKSHGGKNLALGCWLKNNLKLWRCQVLLAKKVIMLLKNKKNIFHWMSKHHTFAIATSNLVCSNCTLPWQNHSQYNIFILPSAFITVSSLFHFSFALCKLNLLFLINLTDSIFILLLILYFFHQTLKTGNMCFKIISKFRCKVGYTSNFQYVLETSIFKRMDTC